MVPERAFEGFACGSFSRNGLDHDFIFPSFSDHRYFYIVNLPNLQVQGHQHARISDAQRKSDCCFQLQSKTNKPNSITTYISSYKMTVKTRGKILSSPNEYRQHLLFCLSTNEATGVKLCHFISRQFLSNVQVHAHQRMQARARTPLFDLLTIVLLPLFTEPGHQSRLWEYVQLL